jgi:hypothetical protein
MAVRKVSFPFSQAIAEEHDAIRTTMKWIENEVARSDAGAPRDSMSLLQTLHGFREHLVTHFAHEERGEFHGGKGALDPEIRSGLDVLTREHRGFEQRIAALIAAIEAAPESLPASFAPVMRGLFEDLRRHDAHETVLLAQITEERDHR